MKVGVVCRDERGEHNGAQQTNDAYRQHLRQLVRNARREQQLEKAPKSSRMLFQYLAQLQADSEQDG